MTNPATGETPSSKRRRDSENMTPLTQPTEAHQTTMSSFMQPPRARHATAATEPPATLPPAPSFTFASLPQALQSVADHFGKQYLKTLTSKTLKEKSIKRLESEDMIPQAAAFETKNFLKAISEVRDSDDFKTLQADVTAILGNTTAQLKLKMIEAGQLEIIHYQENATACFFQAVYAFAELLLIDRDYTDPHPPIRTLALLCLEKHKDAFMLYQDFDVKDIYQLFNKHTESKVDVHIPGTFSAAITLDHAADCLTLFHLLSEIFVKRWSTARKAVAEKEKNAALQVAQRARLKTKATAETAKAMDLEGNMDQSTVDKLIKERVSKETSALKTKLGRLELLVSQAQVVDPHNANANAKNVARGAPAQRASAIKTNQKSTRKKSPKQSQSPATSRPGNDSAAAAANATSSATTKKNRNRKNSKQTKSTANKSVDFSTSTKK